MTAVDLGRVQTVDGRTVRVRCACVARCKLPFARLLSGRARAALRTLDDLRATVRPMTGADLLAAFAETRSDTKMKMKSVRLNDAQVAELERLAVELQRVRPDLAALARGGELSPYTVLRLALDRGLRALADDVDAAGKVTP